MIEARGLSKRYGDTLAVDDLSFTVQPGVVTGFLGPNGAGKYTTMRMLLGLDRPTRGTALISGKLYSSLKGPLHHVGALLDAKDEAKPETNETVTQFIAFVKSTLGDAVSDVRASDRLTDSAVCLVASEHGPDRSLEKLLAGSGRVVSVQKPILEINPRHELIAALAALGDDENAFKEDAAHLLYDEARVLDGERPSNAKSFSDRLARLITRGLRKD